MVLFLHCWKRVEEIMMILRPKLIDVAAIIIIWSAAAVIAVIFCLVTITSNNDDHDDELMKEMDIGQS